MIIRKIEEFEHSSKLLNSAIQSSDSESIVRFRNEVEAAWNHLLLIEPNSKEKSFELIKFFLEKIETQPREEVLNDQCKWKILALARSLGDNSGNYNQINRRRL